MRYDLMVWSNLTGYFTRTEEMMVFTDPSVAGRVDDSGSRYAQFHLVEANESYCLAVVFKSL